MSEPHKWTDERVELLKVMWAKGQSGSEIAAVLGGGCTRCAVIGKVHRLGLTRGRHQQARMTKPRREAARRVRRVPAPRQLEPYIATDPVEFTAATWQPLPGSSPVTLEHATGCRWCVSDPFAPPGVPSLFCNQPVVEGMTWCSEHKARAFGGGTPSEKAAVRFAKVAAKREYAEAA